MDNTTRWRPLAVSLTLAGCLCLLGPLAQDASGADARALDAPARIARASGRSGRLYVAQEDGTVTCFAEP